ncbi:MAG: RimK family alpha-L-glutamate ligase [Candidatus Limiplasma sp.]|nr:RimK family alpha-L-glutamate ligase [Candidatus Limiplasma sp.]MEA5146686.1 RimK family alpha-L-glutamate ligase [Candidatus Limiplasma sp.]
MPHGLMVVNAFLRMTKFDELYGILSDAARGCGIRLSVRTNAELAPIVDSPAFDASMYDFVLFWDKDIALATQLSQRGLPVFNSAESILRCDDKSLTYLTLRQAGIPMPRTILAPKTYPAFGYPDTGFVDQAAQALGFPLVLKECFGSFGQQVYLFQALEPLRQKVRELAGTPMLFQTMVQESLGRDVRVNVVGERVVASILRHSTNGDFRSNLTLGGVMEPYEPTADEANLALAAVRALGLTFAGVDVLFGADGPLICEVNSNAHFKTTLTCTGVNMAVELLREIKSRLGA